MGQATARPRGTSSPAAAERLAAALLASRNRDGGWGYYPNKSSRLEPTCWATLALTSTGRAIDAAVIDKWPSEGPWRIDVAGAPVNFAYQALAGLTMLRHAELKARAETVATALLAVRGERFDQSAALRQDNSLQAWPWMDGTFSWVEPTAVALILLKKVRDRLPSASVKERIDVGERMLVDRVCGSGGWNYGGSNVYGQELFAYVPTTAWGILALQDRPSESAVTKSIARLQADATTEPTAQALALAVIALRSIGSPSKTIHAALEQEVPRAIELGNTLGLAMALYALGGSPDGAFRL